jgi:hypothetical protein
MKLAISETVNTVPAKTASLPHKTGRRRGTTVSEERIMPVLYSPLVISTPRRVIPNHVSGNTVAFRFAVGAQALRRRI